MANLRAFLASLSACVVSTRETAAWQFNIQRRVWALQWQYRDLWLTPAVLNEYLRPGVITFMWSQAELVAERGLAVGGKDLMRWQLANWVIAWTEGLLEEARMATRAGTVPSWRGLLATMYQSIRELVDDVVAEAALREAGEKLTVDNLARQA